MKKILIPFDDQHQVAAAVKDALAHHATDSDVEYHLLNIQTPMPLSVHAYRTQEEIHALEEAAAEKALSQACAAMDAAHLRYSASFRVGEQAEAIAAYDRQVHCDDTVMAPRRFNGLHSLRLWLGNWLQGVLRTGRVATDAASSNRGNVG